MKTLFLITILSVLGFSQTMNIDSMVMQSKTMQEEPSLKGFIIEKSEKAAPAKYPAGEYNEADTSVVSLPEPMPTENLKSKIITKNRRSKNKRNYTATENQDFLIMDEVQQIEIKYNKLLFIVTNLQTAYKHQRDNSNFLLKILESLITSIGGIIIAFIGHGVGKNRGKKIATAAAKRDTPAV